MRDQEYERALGRDVKVLKGEAGADDRSAHIHLAEGRTGIEFPLQVTVATDQVELLKVVADTGESLPREVGIARPDVYDRGR